MVFCLLAGLCCRSPATPHRSGRTASICYLGTPEYEAAIKRLRVQPEQARQLVAEHVRSTRPTSDPNAATVIGDHLLLIGQMYHFFQPRKSGGIPLSGYYVDGHTGKVEFRKVEGSVPYPYQK
jgi:hypothetical protein